MRTMRTPDGELKNGTTLNHGRYRITRLIGKGGFGAVYEADEFLSLIAGKCYGDASLESWGRIYEANKEQIGPDPNHVIPGTELTIPE